MNIGKDHENLCISDECVKEILETIREENPNYTEELILSAIKGCCNGTITPNEKESFIACVKERTKQFYQINYKPGTL